MATAIQQLQRLLHPSRATAFSLSFRPTACFCATVSFSCRNGNVVFERWGYVDFAMVFFVGEEAFWINNAIKIGRCLSVRRGSQCDKIRRKKLLVKYGCLIGLSDAVEVFRWKCYLCRCFQFCIVILKKFNCLFWVGWIRRKFFSFKLNCFIEIWALYLRKLCILKCLFTWMDTNIRTCK